MPECKNILRINTVEEVERFFNLPSSANPLIYVINMEKISPVNLSGLPSNVTTQFGLYAIVMKSGVTCTATYGWRTYDFSKGILSFSAPGQVFNWDTDVDYSKVKGHIIVFHPDLLRKYPLGEKISSYKFFSYQTNEALHISDSERQVLKNIFHNIENEVNSYIDGHSQNIIVSQIDVLLNYAERFYSRQFHSRNSVESDILTRFEALVHKRIDSGTIATPKAIADELAMSTSYLSDCLKNLTGMTAQQHIQEYTLDRAKVLLRATTKTVSEIAYVLGFEYPQYFSRLFKAKTGLTPIQYRNNS